MRSKILSCLLLLPFLLGACHRVKIDPEAEAVLSKLEGGGDLITAKSMRGQIPMDPSDPAWAGAKELTVSLVSQTSVAPRVPVFKKTPISVRALCNRKEIGLRIEWADPTKDETEDGVTRFRDAVAVGVPMNYGEGVPLPYIGMGNKGRPMNIWHWKASWQADIDPIPPNPSAPDGQSPILRRDPLEAGYPVNHRTAEEAGSPMARSQRKSPVENLMAEGFGTLTSVPFEGLTGKGVWKEGKWSVVIKRPRSFKGFVPITFAVWDGANNERNGMKGLARWHFLRFEGEEVSLALLKSLIIGPIPGADPARGKQLVSDMGCISCHNLPSSPAANNIGPDLTHAGSIHRPEYLLESIKDPNAVIVPAPGYYDPKTWTSTMPSFGDQIPEKDYNDVVEYLRGLQ